MLSSRLMAALSLSAALTLLPAAQTKAENIYGLTTSGQIVRFDSAVPSVILGTSPAITGTTSGETIVDIDVYPVNFLLHGVGGTSGTLYRIDPVTGVATVDAIPQSSVGGPLDVDFNPSADRLRIFSASNANFRLTPSVNTAGPTGASSGLVTPDGTLAYLGSDINNGATPNLVSNAYTNNFDGTASTALYSIDTSLNILVLHSGSPAFSTLNTVGALGVDVGSQVGFDVSITGATFVSDGNNLYSVNLSTGALSSLGSIGGPLSVVSITAVPEPMGIALMGLAALVTARRKH